MIFRPSTTGSDCERVKLSAPSLSRLNWRGHGRTALSGGEQEWRALRIHDSLNISIVNANEGRKMSCMSAGSRVELIRYRSLTRDISRNYWGKRWYAVGIISALCPSSTAIIICRLTSMDWQTKYLGWFLNSSENGSYGWFMLLLIFQQRNRLNWRLGWNLMLELFSKEISVLF